MNIVECERELDVPILEVWAVLADFGRFLDWATSGGGSIEVTGEGPGMIRDMTIPGVGTVVERLDRLDRDRFTLSYSLVEGRPLGMIEYRATVTLTEPRPNHCLVSWHGEFEGEDQAAIAANLEGSYSGMSDALVAFIKSR